MTSTRQSAVRIDFIMGKGCPAAEQCLSTLPVPAAVKVLVTFFFSREYSIGVVGLVVVKSERI